jgi:uncharacterized protein involved in outer membrane biogenesis
MNKKKIIIFSVVCLTIIFLVFDFLTYRINKIVKDLLINKSKEFLCQQVVVGGIDTTILGSSIKINNIEIRNLEGFKDKNIIQIKKISAEFGLASVFTNNIIVKNINIEGAMLNYELLLDNREIKDNLSALRQCEKSEEKKNQDKIKNEKENKDKSNKSFVVKKLIVNNSSIKATSDVLEINKEISLSNMTFNNVGNQEGLNKFRDVLKMIFDNILLSINNEIIQGDIKNKIKNKLKVIKNKLSPESLKKLERTFR